MCDHDRPTPPASPRYGARLEDGAAHAADHARWNRRDFLTSLGLAAAGTPLLFGQASVRAFGPTSLLGHLRTLETDRVLVLIQLGGGNDGLNTVVPKTNDRYYQLRPSLAIPAAQTLDLDGEVGLHPSFSALTPVWGEGRMAVVQNVGYPDPNLSHFRSTDIWLTASDSQEVIESGWLGRYLDADFPEFEDDPPAYPLAVQMGGTGSSLFQGPSANMGMSLASPELFEQIAAEGTLYTTDGLPATTYGAEMAFVRTVANDSFAFAGAIQDASETGQNRVEYPAANPLSQNLSIVAQLIKGELGARIYHVSLGGFDTHANQGGANGQHAALLRNLAAAVKAFLDDLAAGGWSERVLVATFSEFGRRVNQNGSGGTDHGIAAPMFLFGDGVEGGLYGNPPDLANLDGNEDGIGDGIVAGTPGSQNANLAFEIDFRSMYATLLKDWFGLAEQTVASVLGGAFDGLGFVSDPASPVATEGEPIPETFTLHQNYPNPFNPTTTITYTLARTERVTLRLYDAQGRLVQTLVDGQQPAGRHDVSFDAGHLASGSYFYRLEAGLGVQTRQMTLVR